MTTQPTQAMTKAPAKRDLVDLINASKSEFTKALGNMMPIDYFVRVAMTTIRKNPLVAQCDPATVLTCLMDLAQLRLVPDSVTGEAYLVPFYNSKKGCYEATLMIGYRGFIKMVRRNTEVINLTADVVYEKDQFIYRKGSTRTLQHTPYIGKGDRGEWLGAYAYIEFKDGASDFVFVPADYIERVKSSSRGSDKPDSPWNSWPEMMWQKTALRQLLKTADISPEVAEAVAKDLDLGSIDIESRVAAAAAQPSKLVQKEELPQPQQQALQTPQQQEKLEVPPKAPEPEKVPVQPATKKTVTAKYRQVPAEQTQSSEPVPEDPFAAPKPQQITAEEMARRNAELLDQMRQRRATSNLQPQPQAPKLADGEEEGSLFPG